MPNTDTEVTLSIQNLFAVHYSKDSLINILEGINLEVKTGEIVGIIGESQSGKSLLREIIVGSEPGKDGGITKGRVEIGGFNIYFNLNKIYSESKNKKELGNPQSGEISKLKIGFRLSTESYLSIMPEFSLNAFAPKKSIMEQITERLVQMNGAELAESILERENIKEQDIVKNMIDFQLTDPGVRDEKIINYAEHNGLRGFASQLVEYVDLDLNPEIVAKWTLLKTKTEIEPKILDNLKEFSKFSKNVRKSEKLYLEILSEMEEKDEKELKEIKTRVRKQQRQIMQESKGFASKARIIAGSINKELKKEAEKWSVDYMKLLGMENPQELTKNAPEELSLGEVNLCSFVLNTITRPRLVILDQVLSVMDPMTKKNVENQIKKMSKLYGMSFLVISRTLHIATELCKRVAIMYSGRIVEETETEELLADPKHPLTVFSISVARSMAGESVVDLQNDIKLGEIVSYDKLPPGCYFEPRCKFALSICSTRKPLLKEFGNKHKVACFLYFPDYEVPN